MKNFKFFAVIIALLSALFLNTCDWPTTDVDTKSFDKKLRGTWVSNDPSIYSGTLKITSSTITIEGYGESQTPLNGDDSNRPFKDIPKRVGHKGHSEDGKIFIENVEIAQNGIPYVCYETGTYPQEDKILEFTFGVRKEILQFQSGF
jgi:hypothetical protein